MHCRICRIYDDYVDVDFPSEESFDIMAMASTLILEFEERKIDAFFFADFSHRQCTDMLINKGIHYY